MNYLYLYNKGFYYCITCNSEELTYYQDLYKNEHFFISDRYLGFKITKKRYFEYQRKMLQNYEKYRNKETEKALKVIFSRYLLFIRKYPENEEIRNSKNIFDTLCQKRYELTDQMLYDFQRNIINIQLNKSLHLRQSSLNIILQKIEYIKKIWHF